MSSLWAVIPIKLDSHPKTRLAGLLSLQQRRILQRAMAEDVMTAITSVESIEKRLVVSDSARAGELANKFGADLLLEKRTAPAGLNSAVAQAAQHLIDSDGGNMLVIHADIPLVTKYELESLLERHFRDAVRRGVTIVPDRFEEGTNCLLCTPPDAIKFRFGPHSFIQHIDEIRRAELHPTVVKLSGAALDVDTPADLEELSTRRTISINRTQTYLRQWLPQLT